MKVVDKIPSLWRIPLLIAAAVVLIVALIWFKDTIGGGIEKFNRWRFNKAVAAEHAEIDKLKAENQRLTDEMKKNIALGEAKQLEIDSAYAELAKYGDAAKKAVAAQQEAAKQYADEKAGIELDVPLHQRCQSYCADRAEAGFPCKPSPDAYCQRYAGR